jgi:hypothetical protein
VLKPAAPTHRQRLEALRDRLLNEIEGGHEEGCPCTCGGAADQRTLAALSKEYRAVLAELEALPAPERVSKSAALRARVESAWASA